MDTNGTSALVVLKPQTDVAEWDTSEKLALLRETYAKGLTSGEFDLFVEHCRQIGLNPLTKQVQPIKFDGKTLSFHTTLHGLVAIACRAGGYAGIDPVHFDIYPKGDNLGTQHPNTASATVYRIVQGQRCSYSAEVYWVERNRGQASWKVQPWTMLGKCAQAAALRLAFEETKGLYIEEELPPQNVVESKPARPIQQPPADQEPPFAPPRGTWAEWCAELAKQLGTFDTKEDYQNLITELTGKDPRKVKLQVPDWQKLAHWLQNEISLVDGLAEEDAGMAKMAGLDDTPEASA